MPKLLRALRPDGQLDHEAIAEAASLLRAGKLVAMPTETVYGLAANALDPEAVARIFAAKGRPSFNPLIVHVPGAEQARALSRSWPEAAEKIVAALWPGPITVVVPKAEQVPDIVTGGLPAVALRSPAHPVAHALLVAAGVPVAAPSANRSGGVSPTTAAHVIASLGDNVDAVLDAGPCAVGIESTVLDVSRDTPRLLRPGGMSAELLEKIVGPIERLHVVQDAGARASPGLQSRHYAPDAQTQLVAPEEIAQALRALPADARIGALVRNAVNPGDSRIVAWERLGDDPVQFAATLYAALHRLDAAGVTHVLLERVPADAAWEAISDRLGRAAGSPDVKPAHL